MSRLSSPRRPGRAPRWRRSPASGRRARGSSSTRLTWSPELPQAGLIPAVERYFEFVQWMTEMNRATHRQVGAGGERAVWCGL